MGFTLIRLLHDVAIKRDNTMMMDGGWNYTNRRYMLSHWDQYTTQ